MLFDGEALPYLMETLVEACAVPTKPGGVQPVLCIAHQWRYPKREKAFLFDLGRRVKGAESREVARNGDLSVFLI